MDVRIAHTVAYLLRCPRSSVPEAMRACKFSLNESESQSRQMTIRRSFAKKPPPDIIDTATAAMTTVSPLTTVRGDPSTQATMTTPPRTPPRTPTTPTTPTTPGGTRATQPKPKQRLIRKSARGMQKFRINKLAASDHAKRALKRATSWYAKELKKTGGLSSYQIEAKVKKEFDGVGPHAAKIRRYINANIAGMSPLKIGVKGDVPTCAFKSLCIAFKSFVRIMQINGTTNG